MTSSTISHIPNGRSKNAVLFRGCCPVSSVPHNQYTFRRAKSQICTAARGILPYWLVRSRSPTNVQSLREISTEPLHVSCCLLSEFTQLAETLCYLTLFSCQFEVVRVEVPAVALPPTAFVTFSIYQPFRLAAVHGMGFIRKSASTSPHIPLHQYINGPT